MLFFALMMAGLLAGGCREDEELNLPDLPASQIGLAIADAAEGEDPQAVELTAEYDADGKIHVSGAISRTYVFTLASAAIEDIVLQVAPLIVSIPEDKVTISDTELTIPAGARSAQVTVTLADNDDFSFAENDGELAEKTYELGVKVVSAEGYLPTFTEGEEAKVIVKKGAYDAGVSLFGEKGNKVQFERSYFDGEIKGGDQLSYTFKAVLTRPAHEDVTVTLTPSGIDEQWLSTMNISPATLTIPAGEKESTEAAVWTMSDEMLLATSEAETYDVLLTASIESADEFVALDEEKKTMEFRIMKVINAIRSIESPVDLVGTRIADRSSWTADIGEYANLFDDNKNTFWTMPQSKDNVLTIDLGREYAISTLRMAPYSTYYTTLAVDILISSDNGQSFVKIGRMDSSNSITDGDYRAVAFFGTLTTRYLQLKIDEMSGSTSAYARRITEIDIFEGDKDPAIYAKLGEDNLITGTISHTPGGSVGNLAASFTVRTNIASDKGYSVRVDVENALVAEYNAAHGTTYAELPEGHITLGNVPCAIAPLAYKSDTKVEVSLTGDLSGLQNGAGYLVPLRLSAPGAASSATQGVVWVVLSVDHNNLRESPSAADIVGTLIADRSGWSVDTGKNVIFDGNTNTQDDAKNFTIDLGETKTLTAFRMAFYFAPYYAPDYVAVETSTDGTEWTDQGKMDKNHRFVTGYDYITGIFISPIQARYVRLKVDTTYSYLYYGMGEFDAYAQ